MLRYAVLAAAVAFAWPAMSHDVYTGLHGKDGRYCCNGDANGVQGDCAPALARPNGEGIDFLVRGKDWVHVPNNVVTFLPVPGEEKQVLPEAPSGMTWGHFCGRKVDYKGERVFDGYYVYCAFVDPGAT